jgi:TPR repeat protein
LITIYYDKYKLSPKDNDSNINKLFRAVIIDYYMFGERVANNNYVNDLKKLSNLGHVTSTRELAVYFVERNNQSPSVKYRNNAIEYLLLAVQMGDSISQRLLSLELVNKRLDLGMEDNIEYGWELLELSANQGEIRSLVLMGMAYEDGFLGFPLRDDSRAKAYYLRACKLGDDGGCYDVSRMQKDLSSKLEYELISKKISGDMTDLFYAEIYADCSGYMHNRYGIGCNLPLAKEYANRAWETTSSASVALTLAKIEDGYGNLRASRLWYEKAFELDKTKFSKLGEYEQFLWGTTFPKDASMVFTHLSENIDSSTNLHEIHDLSPYYDAYYEQLKETAKK